MSSDSATGGVGGGFSYEPWMPSKDGGGSSNPLPPIPYPQFMKLQKGLFGDIFSGGGWSSGAFFSSGRSTSQGGGPQIAGGGSRSEGNTNDSVSGRFRNFFSIGRMA